VGGCAKRIPHEAVDQLPFSALSAESCKLSGSVVREIMQVLTRRLLVISAIALGGGLSGLALGNFVAGGERRSGADELAAFVQSNAFEASEMAEDRAFADPVRVSPTGPTSYDCQGCDAGLHARNDSVDLSPVEPMPPYDPYADAEPPVRPRARTPDQPDARIGDAPLIVE